jgi:hypothetical protein
MLITAPITPPAGTRLAPIVQPLGWAIAAVSAIAAVARKARDATPHAHERERHDAEIPSTRCCHGHRPAVPRATVSAMHSPAPTPDTVTLSAHATWQYQQRVKPGLDLDAARDELERLRPLGEITTLAPDWVNAARPAPYYLLLSDAIVLPLAPQAAGWVATTCVTQRTLTPTRRSAKSARKASLAARKRARRRTRH